VWLTWAARSKLAPFVDLARRIRIHFRPDIIHTLIYRLSNGRIESVNTKICEGVCQAVASMSPNSCRAM
jgi:transposase